MIDMRPEDRVIFEEVERTYATIPIWPGDVVLDLGAHVGAGTLLFLDRGAARVIAVEPDPANLDCLRANTAGLPVEVIAAAVGAIPGEVMLYAHPQQGFLSSTEASEPNRIPHPVPVVAFADLLARHEPDIVKCDIEFGEYDLPELWDLPPFVRGVALEIHLRYELVFEQLRETTAELLGRRRRAASLLHSLREQGFVQLALVPKLGTVPGIDDDTGIDPLARSLDGVWVRER